MLVFDETVAAATKLESFLEVSELLLLKGRGVHCIGGGSDEADVVIKEAVT